MAVLDETDSGLDIDAMRIVADGVKSWRESHKGLILITHYERLLNLIKPDFIHIVSDGKIVQTGGFDLASKLEQGGYEPLLQGVL